MNYHHIIYTSSEKGISGSSGFGVRSATQGTPDDLLRALGGSEVFSFYAVGPQMVTSAIAQNPEVVRGVLPVYLYNIVQLPDGRRFHLLGRKVDVGFDYSFYKNGKPTRPGNYVVDLYAFEQVPGPREFEIFLENAADGSEHFVPLSPCPTPDNEEMRAITTGYDPAPEATQHGFAAKAPAEINQRALDLLFAFIRSRKEGKPLMVKVADEAEAARMMAAIARLVPDSMRESLTFLSNYQSEGKKPGISICFTNSYYNQVIDKTKWVIYDFTDSAPVSTPESEAHGAELLSLAAAGDFDTLHKKVEWCRSEMFDRYSTSGAVALSQLYNYFFDYDRFSLAAVSEDAGLRKALADCFERNPQDQKRFDESLQKMFDLATDLDAKMDWMDYIMAMPMNLKPLIEHNKAAMTKAMLGSQEAFLGFRRRFFNNYERALGFIDKDAYNHHLAENMADPRYSELFEGIFEKFGLDTDAKIGRLTMNLCSYTRNPNAKAWAAGKGAGLFSRLYAELKRKVHEGTIRRTDAADVCHNLLNCGYPESVVAPFRPLQYLCAGTADNIAPDQIKSLTALAMEMGDNDYLRKISRHILANPAMQPAEIVPYFINNSIVTPERIMLATKQLSSAEKYRAAVLRHLDLKPQAMLDMLCAVDSLAMTDEDAMSFLQRYFHDAYEKILKSRQPSVFTKIMGSLKSKFAKKDEPADDHNSSNKKKPKNK